MTGGTAAAEFPAAPWPHVALDAHVRITSGLSPSRFAFGTGGTPYFKVQQLSNSGKYLGPHDTPYFARGASSVPAGSVVFAKRGAAIRLNKIRIFSEPAFMDTNLMALTPVGHFSSEYLFYALSFVGLWDIADVTSVPQINNKHIKPMRLPLPGAEEQVAIVTALGDADQLVEAHERVLSKKREVMQGVVQQLLSGRTRLPGFSDPWAETPMSSLGSTYGGLTGKSKEHFGVGRAGYVPFTDVMSSVRLPQRTFPRVLVAEGERQNAVRAGDLLFNGSSETPNELAMCSVVGDVAPQTYLNSFCFGFRLHSPDIASPIFLAYLFRGPVGRALLYSLAQGAIRYNLSKSQFRRIQVSLPSIDEQRAVAKVLSEMEDEIQAHERRLVKVRALRRGMAQQILTGNKRLVTEESIDE